MPDRANDSLVLFSGGMDSTIALFYRLAVARKMGGQVHCLTFSYGQRHSAEIERAKDIVDLVANDPRYETNIGTHVVQRVHMFSFDDGTSLIGGGPVMKYDDVEQAEALADRDNSFVPYRNLIFLTLAAQYAHGMGIHNISTGLRGGFPDCTSEFERNVEWLLRRAVPDYKLYLNTPTHMPRSQCLLLAARLPGCMEAIGKSLTCFEGSSPPCGHCLPCLKRAQGFADLGIADPATG